MKNDIGGSAMNKVKTGAYIPFPAAPIVLVGADVDRRANFAAVGFVSGVNLDPAIISISLNKRHYTAEGIKENGTFSINIPAAGHVEAVDYCGIVSGRRVDKSNLFSTFYGELDTAPMIEEFPITCECRCTGQMMEFAMDTVYFGEVVQVYINAELTNENRKISVQQVNPLCYAGVENRYYTLGAAVGTGWKTGRGYRKLAK